MEFFSLPLTILKATWWFLTPLILWFVFKDLWLYWRNKLYIDTLEWVLLEIRVPQEVFKTPKAMEYVLVGLHGVWDDINMRDIWMRGEQLPWFSLEIVGIEGEMHFFIYTQTKYRDLVESKIYSQYPDAEIFEAEDYVNLIPPDAPNKDWDIWCTDLQLNKDAGYPLRSYEDFEEMVEERRLDPISSISEVINKLRPGEHMWIQFLISPIMTELRDEGEKLMTKLMGRPEKEEKSLAGTVAKSITDETLKVAGVMPQEGEKEEEKFFMLPEFRLSPGEREIIKKIEEKTAKVAFKCMIRFMYIGKNDVFTKANIAALFGYFRQFNTYNLNSFRPNRNTFPRRSFVWFKKTRGHMRKMRMLWRYKIRYTMPGGISRWFFLNVEELASMYHFPGQVVKAPTVPRVASRKAPAPPSLPVE